MLIHPSAVVGLKCSFHCFILIYCYNLAFEVQNYLFLFKQPNDNEDLSILVDEFVGFKVRSKICFGRFGDFT